MATRERFGWCGWRIAAALALFMAAAPTAKAGFILITDRSQLTSNDSFDWSQLGPSNTILSPPLSLSSAGGAEFVLNHLSTGDGDLFHRLLVDPNVPGAITASDRRENFLRTSVLLDFDQPISEFGFDLRAVLDAPSAGAFGSVAELKLEALSSSGTVLASFILGPQGTRGFSFTGFVGIKSDEANIDTVRVFARADDFILTSGSTSSTRITLGRLDFHNPSVTAVPEPSTLCLALFGGSFVVMVKLRRGRLVS